MFDRHQDFALPATVSIEDAWVEQGSVVAETSDGRRFLACYDLDITGAEMLARQVQNEGAIDTAEWVEIGAPMRFAA